MAEHLHPFTLDLETGGLHAWSRAAGTQHGQPALLCLPPLPFDGTFFDRPAPLLGARRDLVCPDYPGFGRSDPLPGPMNVEAWADALAAAVTRLFPRQPVDVLGFHTGCLIGARMALAAPERVRRLVMIDVPFFDAEQRIAVGERTANAPRHVGKPEAIAGLRAAFAWDPVGPFRRLEQPALVIGTGSTLHGPSEAAAKAAPGARFLSRPDLEQPVFETGGEQIAACCDRFLEEASRGTLPPVEQRDRNAES